jgi:NDP-4-keto-2,6-dideoxyhexose 3-C-methyltransferase
MVDHLQSKAATLEKIIGPIEGLVLDIGSNDGTLLRSLDRPGTQLIGIDPAGKKFEHFYPPHIHLIPDFFSAELVQAVCGAGKLRVITSIAMFYDVEEPLRFASQIASLLREDGVWMFEQSYLPFMLENSSYDTVCHEHLEYYTVRQILIVLERAGLKMTHLGFNGANGGSFCVVASHRKSSFPECSQTIVKALSAEDAAGLTDGRAWPLFRQRVTERRTTLLRFLERQRASRMLTLGYGASTKGNVLLQYCGITQDLMPAIAEVNSDKFGSFTPGTKIPIISEVEAASMSPSSLVVLPWHFRDGIVLREHQYLDSGGRLVFPLPTLEIVDRESLAKKPETRTRKYGFSKETN